MKLEVIVFFAPRDDTDYACESCSFKTCEDCGEKLPKYMFLECDKCNKTHCFNNTDMTYDNNPMLKQYNLCNAKNCGALRTGEEQEDGG